MPAIPLLLCGKLPDHVAAVSKAVRPNFEIIHHSSTTTDAIAYLSMGPVTVRAAMMGAGFSSDDFMAVRSIPGGTKMPWLRPAHTNPDRNASPPPGAPPSAETIATRCRKGLEGKAELFKADGSVEGWEEGDVWYF